MEWNRCVDMKHAVRFGCDGWIPVQLVELLSAATLAELSLLKKNW